MSDEKRYEKQELGGSPGEAVKVREYAFEDDEDELDGERDDLEGDADDGFESMPEQVKTIVE